MAGVLAVELIGDHAYERHEVEAIVAESVAAANSPQGWTNQRFINQRLLVGVEPRAGLLTLPEQLLGRLPRGVRAQAVLAQSDNEVLDIMTADELRDVVRDAGPSTVVFAVSDAVTKDLGIIGLPTDYLRTVTETRFGDVVFWLRTIQPASSNSGIMSLAVTPDGAQAVTGHVNGGLTRWDLETGLVIDFVERHPASVRALTILPSTRTVASAGKDGVRELDGSRPMPDTEEAISLAHHPGEGWLVSGHSDGTILLFRDDDIAPLERLRQEHAVTALAATEQEFYAAAGREIRRWTWGGSPSTHPRPTATKQVRTMAVTPDGRTLVYAGGDHLERWDLFQGQFAPVRTGSTVMSVAVTPDGHQAVSGHADGTLRRWNVATGNQIGQSTPAHEGQVHAVAFTLDAQMIVTAGADGRLRRWDAHTGAPITDRYSVRQQLPDVVSDIESATDALGVAGDVHTIATVLAAASTKPPLSVALLGDWGAGKSSFMRQLRDKMTELSHGTAMVGDQKAYVSNLRQVTFNAWHYSDDHLWVGLIEQIFRELRAAPPAPADPARVHVLEEQLDKQDTERAAVDRELVAMQRMDTPLGKVFAPFQSWRVFRGLWSWRLLVGVLALAAGIAVIVLGQQIAGVALAVLGPAVALWSGIGQYVETARVELQARRTALDQKIQATTDELVELDPARRLDQLLAEITAEDRYADFRGLTGRIHHDLRRLSADLAKARTNKTAEPPLQRIVLYVDDLDRCTPARVVDVLQAVNLLLTMDLFMVVVAVDPRWLLRSLERHHSGLFDEEVGPVVYLDKIFHIPFALRPMGNRAVAYLHSLLPDIETETPPAPERAPAPDPVHAATAISDLPVSSVLPTPVPATTPPPPRATAEGLRVTAEERDFLGRLTPLLTTPRAIKKLTNLYRLLRLSVPRSELRDFLDGQYQVAALLLAILAGTPNQARHLLVQLTSGEEAALVTDLAAQYDVDQPADVYRRWAAEIARFGFTTYDLYPG